LHNDTRSCASSIANRRRAVLTNFELMQQRNQDPATRAPERVAERNRASSWVDIIGTETKDLGVGFDDHGEGFVELPDGDVFLLEAGLLEELLDAGGGGDGEVDGVC
jgi:hypothetical protein